MEESLVAGKNGHRERRDGVLGRTLVGDLQTKLSVEAVACGEVAERPANHNVLVVIVAISDGKDADSLILVIQDVNVDTLVPSSCGERSGKVVVWNRRDYRIFVCDCVEHS